MKMLLSMLLTLLAWGAGARTPGKLGLTADGANQSAIKYRMNAGFPGDVNRVRTFSIEPAMNDDAGGAPVTLYGQFCVIDADGNAVRRIGVADQSDAVSLMAWGCVVRPNPTMSGTSVNPLSTVDFGGGGPLAKNPLDVLRLGYIMAVLNDVAAAPKKGDPVYVWCAADNGVHKQSGIEAVASGGNTVKLANAVFNGAGDAAGNIEVVVGDRRSL